MSDSLYGQRASYVVARPVRLQGLLDVPSLQRSLDHVIARHEVLRTFFRFEDGDVAQIILPELTVPIVVEDLGHLPENARFEAAQERAAVEAAIPFDLSAAPLLRATLYRLTDADHLLALCFHHIVFDGWSERILWQELKAFYEGNGADAGLEELAIQYSDFAAWQREQHDSHQTQASLAYWKNTLAGAPAMWNFPLDAPRPSEPSHRGGRELMILPASLIKEIQGVARTHGATLYMALLAVYSIVLHRYSGDSEVVIGTALAGRTRPELEPLIGFFINTVALRPNLSGNPTFVEVLERIKKISLDAHAHQDVPFEELVDALHGDRATQMPLFQTIFVLQSAEAPPVSLGGVRVMPLELHNGTSKCDLLMSIGSARDGSEGMACSLEFDADILKASTATRILESFRSVLEGVSAQPTSPIATLPLVSARERALLSAWGETRGDYPREATIPQVFATVVARTPHTVAVSCDGQTLTYSELDARSSQVADVLRRAGVRRGDLVAICLERGLLPIVAQLAVLKAGGAYLPVDTSYPPTRIAFILDDTRTRVVLAEGRTVDLLPSSAARTVIRMDAMESGLPAPVLEDADGGEDLAYVMYTSGSTGQPNGVRIPHRAVLRLVLGTNYVDWRQATTFLQMAPVSFDASTFEVWGPLLHGWRLEVFPDRVPTIARIEEVLQKARVDCLWLTAAFFNFVIDERPECLSGVRQLLVGGEALSVPHIVRAQKRLPFTQLINGYGPTECTTFACCYPIPPLPAGVTSVPIGRPIGNTSVKVVDAQGQLVPVGVVGELYIGGDGVAQGYHDRPALTAARFVADPTGATTTRWYRTGDLVRWTSAGVVDFVGRVDSQVKVRGFRVEPGEIEAVCRQHPAVADVAVVLSKRSATDARLQAFAVRIAGAKATIAEVRQFLEEQLPSHLVPSEMAWVESLPLTANGKVDRAALAARPQPLAVDQAPASPGSLPQTSIEQKLICIWRELLRVESVGVDDDFFTLGGHSLLAVRMVSDIHKTFGRSLPFSALLQHRTVAKLATLLESPTPPDAKTSSLVPLQRSGSRLPLFLLPGIGSEVWTFLELTKELADDQPIFGVLPNDTGSGHTRAIDEMAKSYAAEIEAAYPEGPYILGGYCSGAVTAFEVARQLRLRGKSVRMLVVFEYWSKEERCTPLAYLRNVLYWFLDDFMHTSLSNNVGRVKSKARLLAARWRRRSGPSDRQPDVRDVLGMWRYPAHEVKRLADFLEALQAYHFTRYDGPIHVFRARTRGLSRVHPSADMGWRDIADGPLTIETVPGSHDTMFAQPFVRTLAARLDDVIRTAQSPNPTGNNAEQ